MPLSHFESFRTYVVIGVIILVSMAVVAMV